MTDPLLRVDSLSKAYPVSARGGGRWRTILEILRSGRTAGSKSVLEDISFEVRPGESVGIVGSNGAGKSTLLKLITGVLAPSRGEVTRRGSIAALHSEDPVQLYWALIVCSCFGEEALEFEAEARKLFSHADLLVRTRAAEFLGLTRTEVEERLDDILSFADIGDAIHEPIKTYSSGMVVRLGFAVVASVRPDLLITDEVLAVGDESFQKKCIRWIERYLAEGGTLLMVSHNMYQVQKLCRNALWLEQGRVRAWGDVFDVTQGYLAWHERHDAESRERSRVRRPDASRYRVDRLEVRSLEDSAEDIVEVRVAADGSLRVDLELHSPDDRAPQALIGIVRGDGTPVYGVATDHEDVVTERIGDHRFAIGIDFTGLPLLPGNYLVRAHAMDPEGLRLQDTREKEFVVTGRSRALGLVTLPHRWRAPTSDDNGDS